MATFREMCFTPAEFAALAMIKKDQVGELENQGKIKTFKKKVGNVDRKMITLEDLQAYFQSTRAMGTGAEAAGQPIPVEALENGALHPVATATDS